MHGATDYGRYHLGGCNVLAARLVEHVWGAPRRPRRLESGQVRLVADFGAAPGRRGGQIVAQDAKRHGAATRTRSYAHCGVEGMAENVTYFKQLQKAWFLVPNQGAPDATHSKRFGT